MKKLMTFICVAVLAAPGMAVASEMEELEMQMEEARRALDEAARKLAQLHTTKYGDHKSSKRAMLGVLLGDGPMRGGVELVGVTPGGGAEQAGVLAGDKIVRIGDIDLGSVDRPMRKLSQFMKGVVPGESVAVVYQRDGEETDAVIVTQAHSSHIMKMVTSNLQDMDFDFDFDFKDMAMPHVEVSSDVRSADNLMFVEGDLASYFDVDQGVVLTTAPDGSELKAGDVLLEINGADVGSVADALVALGQEGASEVRVKRDGREMNIDVASGEFDQVVKEEIRVIRVKRQGPGGDKDVHVEVITD